MEVGTRTRGRDRTAAYEALLRAWTPAAEGPSLYAAYELGRTMCRDGAGVLDVIAVHTRAVAAILADTPPGGAAAFMDVASRALVESLVPFEMTHRGFRETHVALHTSEARYRELVENANDIIFTTDLEGRLTSINRAGLVLTGYSRTEALAVNVFALIDPADRVHLRALRRPAPDGSSGRRRFELEITARDGRRVPLDVSARLVVERGRAVGVQGIARDITDRRRADAALRRVNQGLENKVKRIAHALHDEAGQLLASVYLRVAEIAARAAPDDRGPLDALRGLLDGVDDQIRRLAHELRPTILDDLGLMPACEFLAEGVSARAHLAIAVRGSTGGRLPPDVETALYRVTQEALTNAGKHAHATEIVVEFARTGGGVHGAIRDNGVGFDLPAVLARVGEQGLGLMGMRERLVSVSGELLIASAPGRGTSIEFDVPLGS